MIEQTKKTFADAFCILNRQKPIEKISIRELSEKAGYNRNTFYKHFKDIYDLRDFIDEILISRIRENFLQNITKENFAETFIDCVNKLQTDKAKYFDVMMSIENRGRFTEKLIKNIEPIFKKKFDIADEKFADYIVESYFNIVLSNLSFWIANGRNISIAELSKFISEVLTTGIIK